jgi:hypothetical protein
MNEIGGTLPYGDLGDEYALYMLSEYVDSDGFDGSASLQRSDRAIYNHQFGRVQNSCFEYMNRPEANLESDQIVLASKPRVLGSGLVCLGLGDGRVHWINDVPGEEILGALMSWEGLFFKDRNVLNDWLITHRFLNQPAWSVQYDSKRHPIEMNRGNSTMQFQYSQGRLSSCTIRTADSTIEERISTDRYGVILRLSRSEESDETTPNVRRSVTAVAE